MKKLFLVLSILLTFGVNAFATPVTVAASTQSNFNPSGLSGDVTGVVVAVTNSSTTVTSSALFRAAWVGMSGFRVSINGTAYTVAYVASQSSLTLTANYAGATGAASMTLYKYVEVRFYSSISFRPLGNCEATGQPCIIQIGTPGSGSWFKRIAAGIVNVSGVNILYIPQFTIDSTTDSVDNNQARYTIGFYRPEGSLVQYYTCSGASQFRIPFTTPTSLPDLCIYNSAQVIQTIATTYTTTQIDARFPSCTSGQMIYYAATGQNQTCLSVGSGLQITGATLSATGGGGGGVTGSGTTDYVPIWTSSSALGASQLFYDGFNTRFQSQKDFLIFTTNPNSRFLIDTSVTLEGSDTRVVGAHMFNLKGVAGQTGDYERFTDSASTVLYRVDKDGDVYPRGVTTAWPSANAVGALTNNGSGTLTWSAATGTVTGTGSTNYLPIWTSASALGSSQMFYDGANTRFQSQKDILIFTTAANSRLLIDTSVTVEGSDTRAVGAHMVTLKGVTGQTGQYLRFLDDTNALKFAVDADGDMYPRGVTTAWPSANAAGSLVNNGSGTLSWSAASVTGIRQAINVKLDYGCIGDGVADDTACIVAALAAAASAATKQVYFPGGTYLTTGFTVTGEVSLIGDGDKKTIISSTTNAVIVNVVGSGATDFRGPTIEGMKIQGTVGAGSSQIGLKVDDGTYVHSVRVRNVTIANAGSNGLYVGNAYSSAFENMFITNCNAYPLLYNAANMPTNRFESIYIGDLRNVAGALTGFRIKAGDFVCHSCNGVNSGPTASRWLSAGKKNGVDGDVTDVAAAIELHDSNLESWDAFGIYAYSGSTINLRGRTSFAGNGTAGQIGIYFDLTGNGSVYFSEFVRQGIIEDGVDFADGVAAYSNSQPIHSNGYPNLLTEAVGPSTGGGVQLSTYHDTTGTPASRKLGRSDGKVSVQTVTATQTISRPGVKYIAMNHTVPATLTIPWAGWYQRAQETLTIQDVSAAGANTNNIIIAPTTGTINGAATYTLNKAKQTVVLMPDGDTGAGNWRIVSISTATQAVIASGSGGDYLACWDSTGTFLTTCPAYRLGSATVLQGGLLQDADNTNDWGASGANRPRTVYVGTDVRSPKFTLTGSINWTQGAGSPETVVTADVGAIYSRNNGGAGTTLYIKEVGAGNTGWTAVSSGSGSGTVNSGVINSITYYPATGTTVDDTSGFAWQNANPNVTITSQNAVHAALKLLSTLNNDATIPLFTATTADGTGVINLDPTGDQFASGTDNMLLVKNTSVNRTANMGVVDTVSTNSPFLTVVAEGTTEIVIGSSGSGTSSSNLTTIPDSQYIRSNGTGGLSIIASAGAGVLKFATGGSAAANERMRISAVGLVTIGLGVAVQAGSQAASDTAFLMPFTGGTNSSGPGVRWGTGASYTTQSSLYLSNGLVWQGATSTHDPFKIRTGTGTSSDGTLVFEFRPSDGVFNFTPSTANTTNRLETNVIDITSTGTPGNGFGGQITYKGESSTSGSQQMAAWNWAWTDATHASRTAKAFVQTIYNAGALAETWGVQAAQTYGAAEFANGNKSGSFTIDFNSGNNQTLVATGNISVITFSNIKVGARYVLVISQDGTGGRTWTPPTLFKMPGGVGGNVLTGSVNAKDVFDCISSDGTNLYCNGLFDVKNP